MAIKRYGGMQTIYTAEDYPILGHDAIFSALKARQLIDTAHAEMQECFRLREVTKDRAKEKAAADGV